MDTIWEWRVSIIPALTLLDFDDGTGGVTLYDFFATPGTSPLFHSKEEAETFVAEMGSAAARVAGFVSERRWPRPSCALRVSSLSCGPRKRLPHLLRPLVRPPALSRVGALGIITADAVRMLNARPLPRPTSQFVMQLTVQLPPPSSRRIAD